MISEKKIKEKLNIADRNKNSGQIKTDLISIQLHVPVSVIDPFMIEFCS